MQAKFYLTISLIFLLLQISYAQSAGFKGTVHESLAVKSNILGRDIKYSVYLPSDYGTSDRSYPILYLLHGSSDNEVSWIQFGEINLTADKLINSGESVPLVIIMPDGGLTYYINNYNDSVRYEDAFFTEFIPAIEKTYRIRATKEFRAIGGLSMGGYGSLLYAFKHPDMFSGCVALSAAVRNDSLMAKRLRLGEGNSIACYGKLNGDILPETWRKNSLLDLSATIPVIRLKTVKYYIDCGDKDERIFGNSLLNNTLNTRNVPHEFRVREGNHTWPYWRQGIADGLRFLSALFHR